MPSYTHAILNTDVGLITSGSYTAANFQSIANASARAVALDIDLRSAIRTTTLTPNLFEDIYEYNCPSDIKGNKIIDIQNQKDRTINDRWQLLSLEEFDRRKEGRVIDEFGDELIAKKMYEDSFVSFARDDLTNKLLLSRYVSDHEVVIDNLDAVSTWVAFGDATNVTLDTEYYVKGTGSINWDINADGGTTAGIVNPTLTSVDISGYLTTGSIFAYAFLSDSTDVTNFVLRIGSSSSNYYTITVTTDNAGNSFGTGLNLLRFDLEDKVETGTVVSASCDYLALYMTKDSGKVSETDYRFDWIVIKRGEYFDLLYYSKYTWQSSTGTFLENSTATTDYLNVDTDEYDLIRLKTAENIEMHLRNTQAAQLHRANYEMSKRRYLEDNPSQAMSLVQKYYRI